MKFAIDKHHRDFFQKNGFIELEILSSGQIAQWNQTIDQILERQSALPNQKHAQLTTDQIFSKGRDLWRSDEKLRTLTIQPRLAELVSELIEKKPVRLGYTQFFSQYTPTPSLVDQKPSPYRNFLQQKTNLETISCVDNILCGLMLSLSNAKELLDVEAPQEDDVDIFSTCAGNAILFRPDAIINLEHFFKHPDQRYYLIVYTENTSYYYPQPKDPLGHALKHIGYIFNDKLSDKLNPIVYR